VDLQANDVELPNVETCNVELLTHNEELSASNVELLTNNVELPASNVELLTINVEMPIQPIMQNFQPTMWNCQPKFQTMVLSC